MQVTSVGHAGLFIESKGGTILCDPWVNPAYFASWFPFPDNSQLDWAAYREPDYLYVSHLHRDHYDPDFLRDGVSHDTTVLLPDYRTPDLENALRALGFRSFVHVPNSQPITLDRGLRVMIVALVSPSDGPIGDSALAVDDGEAAILNQNDAKPIDLEPLKSFGRFDAHFLQFSGANWWPMVYDLPENAKTAFGTSKRANGLARAYRYVEEIDARYVVPSAGPPAFLDDDLIGFNDVDNSPANPFPDHTVFVEYLRSHGRSNALLMVPGSTLRVANGEAIVRHPSEDALKVYEDKRSYLKAYAQRVRSRIAMERASWPAPGIDILGELKRRMEPLLRMADRVCTGVGAPLLLEIGDEDRIVIDFIDREVRPWNGEKCRYRFRFERPLVERLLADGEVDWVNSLFLSMRFRASRIGPYNEFVYTFFKCLSPERMAYAERWYAEQEDSPEEIRLGDWMVQRKCPHRGADLGHFGELHGDRLRCTMHGYEFDLSTGRCLTASDRPIRARRAEGDAEGTREEQHEVPED
ncbi:Rieske 2Fe-2S domain-containing protein [Thermasporomyces composti]|jgi:UDP-MurNAc hydroxylase|uniref:UDP-MurNAc hydroxylase n=1 Tax=Thermasporomyces composti TaxID=696763 RepID=A0A3D9V875_THECX|nr:Rieske 2Fe-2S domain-containing protein [Thermasporomyces composti]REF37998.1 UDP-MurNAc hydroxylase [Thermasporomyces composti]